jgi:threonine synthase
LVRPWSSLGLLLVVLGACRTAAPARIIRLPDPTRPPLAGSSLTPAQLEAARAAVDRGMLAGREPTLWRYRELLPVRDLRFKLCLGEGFSPLFPARRLGDEVGFEHVSIQDEGLNPTGSFKARGLAVAVSRAWELGVKSVSIPTAGNAGCAMSAYAALAGIKAHVFMPADAPKPFINECRVFGAAVTLIDGLITDCGKAAREGVERYGRFDVSTLKEPYRIEGKKTLGFEIAEQLGWQLPDVILYPTGIGTGLIGLWKSFQELEQLGGLRVPGREWWLSRRRIAPLSSAPSMPARGMRGRGRTRAPLRPACGSPPP